MQYPNNYTQIHTWLNETFGKATICIFCGTKTAKRYEYCLLKNRIHSKNLGNYIQLCTSCHRKYDYTDKTKQKIRNSMIENWRNNRSKRLASSRRGFNLSTEHIESIRKSKLGNNNPAKRLEVRIKISNTLKRLHRESCSPRETASS